ncbi:MAG TPA: hypothetical protein VNW95_10735 [Mucilaginibacter sp.]|jgi:hypothetical protein|nr:hypothetical protein [Mucilaginibacter sp.]
MENQQLAQFLETLKTDLINTMQANGRYATGQTARQFIITGDENSMQLQLPGYTQVLETGRGPTEKNAAASDLPMIQRIKEWCQARGIPDKAAWAIKKSIDKKGYKGIAGLLSEPLGDENINLRLTQVMESIAAHVSEQIVKELNA